jgi:hypothetical protein
MFEYKTLVETTQYPYAEIPAKEEVIYWKDFEKVFTWIKDNTFPSDLLTSNLDPVVYLYTGRKSIIPYNLEAARWIYRNDEPPLGSDEEIISHLTKIKSDYLVILPMNAESNREYFVNLVAHLAEVYPEKLKLVYKGEDSRFQIYKVTA